MHRLAVTLSISKTGEVRESFGTEESRRASCNKVVIDLGRSDCPRLVWLSSMAEELRPYTRRFIGPSDLDYLSHGEHLQWFPKLPRLQAMDHQNHWRLTVQRELIISAGVLPTGKGTNP
jgi:hypothetical protein